MHIYKSLNTFFYFKVNIQLTVSGAGLDFTNIIVNFTENTVGGGARDFTPLM